MKSTFSRSLVALTASIGLLTTSGYSADEPEVQAPTLEAVLQADGGKSVVFQPYQLKRGQSLVVSHVSFSKKSQTVRPGRQQGVMLVIYSTDSADYGHALYQDIFIPAGATGVGAGPHVKVFNGFTPEVDRKGIIAVLIGLLMPTDQNPGTATMTRIPGADSISAEIHDGGTGIGLLLPAVQKVREAAAR